MREVITIPIITASPAAPPLFLLLLLFSSAASGWMMDFLLLFSRGETGGGSAIPFFTLFPLLYKHSKRKQQTLDKTNNYVI